jgi:hypothetical protein
MYASAHYINIISIIPNNTNKKINIHFSDFCSAGSSLQFMTTDSQTSYRNYRSDFCPCILLIIYCTKVVCSLPPILTFLCPVRMAAWLKAQGLCTLLQLASNFLVASARWQTETRASYHYLQLFCCLENGSRRISQQLFCCSNRKVASARSHIKQCSPSVQLKSCTTKVASARLA